MVKGIPAASQWALLQKHTNIVSRLLLNITSRRVKVITLLKADAVDLESVSVFDLGVTTTTTKTNSPPHDSLAYTAVCLPHDVQSC